MSTVLLTSPAYGHRVGLRVSSAALAVVDAVLPFWWSAAELEPEQIWDVTTPATAERVVREMELWVAEHAVGLVFVHAGVVAVDGRALLLPGRSMAGKTTLTAALLRAGATYGSDEYAVLDTEGRAHPYPRALSVRGPDRRLAISPASLGAVTVSDPVPVRAIALLSYRPGAAWAPTPVSPGAAALRLLDNTVSAQSRPEAALDAIASAAGSADSIESTRGDADNVAQLLLAWFAGLD